MLLSAVSTIDDSLSVGPSVSLLKRYNDDIIYNNKNNNNNNSLLRIFLQ